MSRRSWLRPSVWAIATVTVAVVSTASPAGAVRPPQSSVTALAAPLPASAVLFDSNRPVHEGDAKNYELYRLDADGRQTRLTTDHRYDSWWPKISPDRTKVMFQRSPAGVHDTDYKQSTTWLMNADGSGLREILPRGAHGWEWQGHPEWSPDGTRIVTMCGTSIVAICTVAADGSDPRLVTTRARSTQDNPFPPSGDPQEPRGGTNIDPSWTPDGKHILFVGCPSAICTESQYEIYRIAVDGTSKEQRLTANHHRDHDPFTSPDGTTIAYLKNSTGPSVWGIWRIDPSLPGDGAYAKEQRVVDEGSVNSKPGWSLDSSAIWFHRVELGTTLFSIWRVNRDGSGLTEVLPPQRDPLLGRFGEYDNEFPVNSSF